MINMIFLGTGAADTIPNPFCTCPICEDARTDISTKTRKRSSFMLDKHNLIDFGPDFAASMQQHGVMCNELKNIFITHTHEDHFCASNLGLLNMSVTKPPEPIKLYISQKGSDWLEAAVKLLNASNGEHLDIVSALTKNNVELVKVTPYQEFMAGDIKVFAIETTHKVSKAENGERAINYLFTLPDGKKLLYASDTGIYSEYNLETLKNTGLDYLIMEATFGSTPNDSTSHLNAESFVQMVKMMMEYGIIVPETKVYATHINHKHDLNHERYQQYFNDNSPREIIVARDGMKI